MGRRALRRGCCMRGPLPPAPAWAWIAPIDAHHSAAEEMDKIPDSSSSRICPRGNLWQPHLWSHAGMSKPLPKTQARSCSGAGLWWLRTHGTGGPALARAVSPWLGALRARKGRSRVREAGAPAVPEERCCYGNKSLVFSKESTSSA